MGVKLLVVKRGLGGDGGGATAISPCATCRFKEDGDRLCLGPCALLATSSWCSAKSGTCKE